MSEPLRVVLADDQELIRAGLKALLEARGVQVVGQAADGVEAVELVPHVRPDVVLMDIRMPRLDGVEATRRLAGYRVLVVTTYEQDEYVVEALRAGAAGFILKDTPPDQLVEAIRIVAAGESLLAPSITRRLLESVVRRLPAPASAPPELEELTAREREILLLIARGCSNAEIASTLFLSELTVKSHVSHLLSKLRLRDRVQAVILAYEAGLVTRGDDASP
ncbi:MAG TPA: response regulator transcription factor [Solirubrobacteraceae bacterium]|nr:response regulator transcription factor [Solirubrobacteraceae bacterium]